MEFDSDGAMSIYMKQGDRFERFYGDVRIPDENGNIYIPPASKKQVSMEQLKKLFWGKEDVPQDIIKKFVDVEEPTGEQLIKGIYDNIYNPYYGVKLTDPQKQLEFIEFYVQNRDFLDAYNTLAKHFNNIPDYKQLDKAFKKYRKNPLKEAKLVSDSVFLEGYSLDPNIVFESSAEDYLYKQCLMITGVAPTPKRGSRKHIRFMNRLKGSYYISWLNESQARAFVEILNTAG